MLVRSQWGGVDMGNSLKCDGDSISNRIGESKKENTRLVGPRVFFHNVEPVRNEPRSELSRQ